MPFKCISFYITDRKDPPYDVQGHAISSSRVNITWKIPPGYKTVYFAVHVFDFVKKTDYQEVTSNYASYFVLKDLRPYTKYAIYVQMYADERARGKSEAFWVQTLETGEYLRCFKTKHRRILKHKTMCGSNHITSHHNTT